MIVCSLVSPVFRFCVAGTLLAALTVFGCRSGEPSATVADPPSHDASGGLQAVGGLPASDAPLEAMEAFPIGAQPQDRAGSDASAAGDTQDGSAKADAVPDDKNPAAGMPSEADTQVNVASPVEPAGGGSAVQLSLDELLAALVVPPSWLADVRVDYDTSHPWKDARLEIRRLLSFAQPATHRQAIKLTWIYRQKGDIGDGHEYPMYTFLGGEPLWSIWAHEEFLARPHEHTPIHTHLTLASLYTQYGEFDKAKATLDVALNGLPPPPWDVMRKADMLDAFGDLYAAWGRTDEARRYWADAAALYPTAKPPFGGHLLPRRAAQVQSKLDLLAVQSLAAATLRDGQYQDKALGYADDIDVTLIVRNGKMADIRLRHEEKIDQNACVLIPQRILDAQSLQVDGISGATVTKDAIVHGVLRCLRQAGLR